MINFHTYLVENRFQAENRVNFAKNFRKSLIIFTLFLLKIAIFGLSYFCKNNIIFTIFLVIFAENKLVFLYINHNYS